MHLSAVYSSALQLSSVILRLNLSKFERFNSIALICQMSSDSSSKSSFRTMVLIGLEDVYHGITVKTKNLSADVKENFEHILQDSINEWIENRKRGIWFKVHIKDSELIPVLVRNSFTFHHAQSDYVMMTRWLAAETNTLPKYAHTMIGAGGVVVDQNNRILLMREKRGHYLGWKFPGGLSEPGENIMETAIREVKEETGVETVGESMLMFRQTQASPWPNVGDIYFVCALRLADESKSDISPCPSETAEARWFTREELQKLPKLPGFIHMILQRHDEWKASGRKGCHPVKLNLSFVKDVDIFLVE